MVSANDRRWGGSIRNLIQLETRTTDTRGNLVVSPLSQSSNRLLQRPGSYISATVWGRQAGRIEERIRVRRQMCILTSNMHTLMQPSGFVTRVRGVIRPAPLTPLACFTARGATCAAPTAGANSRLQTPAVRLAYLTNHGSNNSSFYPRAMAPANFCWFFLFASSRSQSPGRHLGHHAHAHSRQGTRIRLDGLSMPST
jgi:hypothetical protein